MKSSKSITGLSRRLQCLLLIALVGYECLIYQRFVWHVPLRPERVVELLAGQSPMGFLPDGVFAIGGGNPERSGADLGPTSGPVEIRAIPSGDSLKDYQLATVDRGDGAPGDGVRTMRVSTTIQGWHGGVLRQYPSGAIEWSREDPYGMFRIDSTWKNPGLARWTLDAEGHLHNSSERLAAKVDRQSDSRQSSEVFVRHPATALIGDRFALFPNLNKQVSPTPWLVSAAKTYLLRRGFTAGSAISQDDRALYDLERREFVGLVSMPLHGLFVDPRGHGFVIQRPRDVSRGSSPLEFYCVPPGRDWSWFLWRGLGGPAAIAAILLTRRAIVRRGSLGAMPHADSHVDAAAVV